MEKKRNNNLARNGQASNDYFSSKKNQEVSTNKNYSRRRKEGYQQDYNKGRNSNQNNTNFYDKRPPARGNGNRGGGNEQGFKSSSETARLMEDMGSEVNSVFNHGSKKQNLNHLLNFHKYTKETDGYGGAFSKYGYQHYNFRSKRYDYNKEQYLQANCQFIVKEDPQFDYRPFMTSPDALVEWNQIVKVLISSCEESQCPICLYPPKAAKMTKCGHIYCFSCMLHYLSLSDKEWRKCPICYESVKIDDLKSTSSKHIHQSYKVGDIISMELIKREKGSLFVNKASETNLVDKFPNFSDVNEETFTYSKLVMANKHEMLKIIEQERNELDFQLAEDGYDCPESIFIQQAVELLNAKREDIEKSIETPDDATNIPQTPLECLNSPVELAESIDDEDLIDEDCDLTVDEIDIVPVSQNVKNFFFYQAPNGQNIFLHSVNSKMLQLMYGSLEQSPSKIAGKIVAIKCCTMNEGLRKRLKYLQHLPVSSVFEIVEIEFEHGTISKDVFNVFKDELLHRRKYRQRREREEKKREKAIDEINDRQMGKMLMSSANIDIASASQFPIVPKLHKMPALTKTPEASASSGKKSSTGPSYSTMVTTPTAQKSEQLWPSLANNKKATPSSSFFGDDKKLIQVAGNKGMMTNVTPSKEFGASDPESDENDECKAPTYKNSLSDALASALKSASLNESAGKKSKKKSKKTLLFSSGMNFN